MKNPFASLTIWGIIAMALAYLGLPIEAAEVEDVYEGVMLVVGLVAGIYGRWRAEGPLAIK